MVNLRDLDRACRERRRDWALLDDELYRLRRDHPLHTDPGVVNAKVGIVARAYATGVERAIPSDRSQGSSLLTLTRFIFANRRLVDGAIAPLRNLKERLDQGALMSAIEAHGQFVKLVSRITRDGRSARSFASKYLHFHCPVVPIYDSVVAQVLPSVQPLRRRQHAPVARRRADQIYSNHAWRFFDLYVEARKAYPGLTVKGLDFYLLGEKAREPSGNGRSWRSLRNLGPPRPGSRHRGSRHRLWGGQCRSWGLRSPRLWVDTKVRQQEDHVKDPIGQGRTEMGRLEEPVADLVS